MKSIVSRTAASAFDVTARGTPHAERIGALVQRPVCMCRRVRFSFAFLTHVLLILLFQRISAHERIAREKKLALSAKNEPTTSDADR